MSIAFKYPPYIKKIRKNFKKYAEKHLTNPVYGVIIPITNTL